MVEGRKKETVTDLTLDDAVNAALKLVEEGEKPTAAAKKTAKETGYSRSEIYSRMISDEHDTEITD